MQYTMRYQSTIKGFNMFNKVTDTIIYILGFISILVVWLTA